MNNLEKMFVQLHITDEWDMIDYDVHLEELREYPDYEDMDEDEMLAHVRAELKEKLKQLDEFDVSRK